MKNLKLQLMLELADKITKPFKAIKKGSKNLQGEMGALAGKMKGLQTAQKNLAQYGKLKESIAKNNAALEEAQRTAQNLAAGMAKTGNSTKKAARQFEIARKRVQQLKQKQAEQMASLSKLRGSLQGAGISTKNLGLSERKLAQNIKMTNAALDQQAKKLEKITSKQKKLAAAKQKYEKAMATKANMSFIGGAGLLAGRGVLSGVVNTIMPGMQFEAGMSKVGALVRVGKGSEDFQKLQDQARALGASTSFKATEAADGMGFLAMAGFEVNEIMSAMPGMLDLAKAGGMELGQTADIASNILSGFNLEASQMGRVSDVLAAAFTRANVDLSMLGETMKYVAPVASELGMSVEESAAMAGLLGNVGIQGSKAGTAMRAIANRLAAPTKMVTDAMKSIELDPIDKATGNMRPMIGIMAEIAKKTEGMGNAERLGIFTDIAGTEAGAAMAALVKQGGAGEIEKLVRILENAQGEANRLATRMGDNAMGDLSKFSSAWEAINISLTMTNTSPLRDLIQYGTEILTMINGWINRNPALAGGILKIVAVVGGLLAVFGSLALGIAAVSGMIAMFKLAWVALHMSFLLSPIGLILLGIAAAAGVILYFWEPIKEFFMTLWDAIPSPPDWLVSYFESVVDSVQWLFDIVQNTFGKIWDALPSPPDWLTGWFSDEGGDDTKKMPDVEESKAQITPVQTPETIANDNAKLDQGVSVTQKPGPVSQTFQITINGAVGDGEEIARIVRREIEAINTENEARYASRLYD